MALGETVLAKALFAAMLMSWGNEVESKCPSFAPTEAYYEEIKNIELIEDPGMRYSIIIAASIQARKKMRENPFTCWYVRGKMMSGDLAFFRMKGSHFWPWFGKN